MSDAAQHLLEDLDQIGFSVWPSVLTASETNRYRERLEILVGLQRDGTLPNTDKGLIHSPMLLDDSFFEVLDNKNIRRITDAALGVSAIMYAFSSSSIAPLDTNYAGRVHVDCPRIVPGYVTNLGMILALSDFTESNGATMFMPRSFETVEPPSLDDFLASAVTVSMKAGDAAVFNTRTWHMAGRNTTNAFRHSLTLNFCRSYMRQRFDYPRMIPGHLVEGLSEQQLQYLGFFVQMPVSWEEFVAPPELRKYRPGQG